MLGEAGGDADVAIHSLADELDVLVERLGGLPSHGPLPEAKEGGPLLLIQQPVAEVDVRPLPHFIRALLLRPDPRGLLPRLLQKDVEEEMIPEETFLEALPQVEPLLRDLGDQERNVLRFGHRLDALGEGANRIDREDEALLHPDAEVSARVEDGDAIPLPLFRRDEDRCLAALLQSDEERNRALAESRDERFPPLLLRVPERRDRPLEAREEPLAPGEVGGEIFHPPPAAALPRDGKANALLLGDLFPGFGEEAEGDPHVRDPLESGRGVEPDHLLHHGKDDRLALGPVPRETIQDELPDLLLELRDLLGVLERELRHLEHLRENGDVLVQEPLLLGEPDLALADVLHVGERVGLNGTEALGHDRPLLGRSGQLRHPLCEVGEGGENHFLFLLHFLSLSPVVEKTEKTRFRNSFFEDERELINPL